VNFFWFQLSEPPPPMPSPKPDEEEKKEDNPEDTIQNKENVENTDEKEQKMETDQDDNDDDDDDEKASTVESENFAKETTENVKSPPTQGESENAADATPKEEKVQDDEKTEEKTSPLPESIKVDEKALDDQNTTVPEQLASEETINKEEKEKASEEK